MNVIQKWAKRALSSIIGHPSEIDWSTSFYSGNIDTAESITEDQAMRITAVYACIRLLGQTVARTPLMLYRRTAGGREIAEKHPVYRLVHVEPNPEMSAFQFKEIMGVSLELRGNFYAQKVYNGAGQVTQLWPLSTDRMESVKRVGGDLIYVYRDSKDVKHYLTREQIFHVAGTGYDGILGFSPIEYNRRSLNLSLGAEQYGNRFFKNDARPSGVIQHPGKLKDEKQIDRMRTSWYKNYGGEKQQGVAVLEEGAQFKEISLSPEHAQFLETRKYNVTDIARIFGVQPHMIGDLDRATFSNIEHQSIEFVSYTMMPRFVRIEDAMTLQLLNAEDRPEYYLEFLTDALLRGDIKARNEALNIQRQNGIINANEWRRLLNMNEIDGDAGGKYLVNGNMIDVSAIGSQPNQQVPMQQNSAPDEIESRAQKTADSRAEATRSFAPVFIDVYEKIARKEKREIGKVIQKYLGVRTVVEFDNYLEEYYNGLSEYIRKLIYPNYRAFANIVYKEVANEIKEIRTPSELDKQFIDDYVDGAVLRYTDSSKGQLKKAAREENPDEAVAARLDQWEESRAGRVTRDEITRASNAIARNVYFSSGFLFVRWVTRGSETCPFCKKLNGMTVGVRDEFLSATENITVDDSTMRVYGKVKHPPLHIGCDCQLVVGV